MEIPIVYAASKRLQPITEAASSIEFITSEDIIQSGATNLGDVLRSVAGIDVRESNAGQHVIGVRGFCDTGHLLVTIDGNNVFMYHANHIFLDWAPIDLEEIDHIEIIKGPGAIFYGGSAFSGVINVITKTPKQLEGAQINLTGGTWNTVRGNIIHARTSRDFDYSISVGHRQAKEWEPPRIDPERERFYITYAAAKAICHLDTVSSLGLLVRYSDAHNVISSVCNPKTVFVALRYERPDFWARLFYNRHEKDFWNGTYGVKDVNREFEIFRTWKWARNIISLGGFAKYTGWQVETLKETFPGGPVVGSTEEHDVQDAALNIENEFHLNDQLILTLGARGEYYTFLDFIGLGRGSIIYKAVSDHGFRITAASGYYIPSLFQHTNEGTAYPFALGDSLLEEEKIISYELGYFGRFTDRILLKANIFYNDYRDLIDNTQSGPMQNVADANQKGAEMDIDLRFTNYLTGFVNYAYQIIHRDDFGDLAVDPKHKVNCGLRIMLPKWSANACFHYVDEYNEIYLTSNPVFGRVQDTLGNAVPSSVESYYTIDARFAYSPITYLELSVAGYNLLGNKHYESNPPDGNPGNWHTGDLIDRRITAGVSCKF